MRQIKIWCLISVLVLGQIATAGEEDPIIDDLTVVQSPNQEYLKTLRAKKPIAPPPDTPSKLSLTYFGDFAGPSIGNPKSFNQVNPDTQQTDPNLPQTLASTLKLNYSVSPRFFFGGVFDFDFFPGNGGDDSIWQDVGLRLGSFDLIHARNLSVVVDLRFQLPISSYYSSTNTSFLLKSVDVISYKIPDTRWYLGLSMTLEYYAYSNPPAGSPDVQNYFAPNIFWKYTQTTLLGVLYQYYPEHIIGTSNWIDSQASNFDLAVEVNVTKDITLLPGLLVYPGNFNFDTLGTQLYIFANFF